MEWGFGRMDGQIENMWGQRDWIKICGDCEKEWKYRGMEKRNEAVHGGIEENALIIQCCLTDK